VEKKWNNKVVKEKMEKKNKMIICRKKNVMKVSDKWI
jgi:hypothetical protein